MASWPQVNEGCCQEEEIVFPPQARCKEQGQASVAVGKIQASTRNIVLLVRLGKH